MVSEDGRRLPKGFGRIHMSHTMEERCQVIKEDAGVFWEDPEDCPYLQVRPVSED